MKKLFGFVMIALSILLVTACSLEQSGSEGEKTENSDGGKVKIGFSISTLNNPFFVTLSDGAKEAAKEAGFEIIITDAQDNPAKQVSDIEDLIQQGIDVLLVNPADDVGVVAGVESANNAGIPVITVDREAKGGEVIAHIASDNVLGGEMAGEYILNELNKQGNVVELQGIAGVLGTRLRGEGFHNIVDNVEGINVVASQNADYDRTKGLTVMENIIQGNPDIDAVFAHNDEMALGAVEALDAQNMLDDVIVVGFDATDDAREAVKEGRMSATVAQQPKLISKYAIDAAAKVIKGEKIEEFIPVELELITN